MDGFLCSRCLNNDIEVPDMMRLFAGGTTIFIFPKGCLVKIFTTRWIVAPPANNLFKLGTSIRSFRHLEHQTLSIILGDIGRARRVQQFWRNGMERRNGVQLIL